MLITVLELCTACIPSTVSELNNEESSSLKVLAVTPTTFGPSDPLWDKGEEIVPIKSTLIIATKEIT